MSASVISGIVESTSLFCYTVGMHWLLGSRKTESVWTCWIARRSIYVQRLCVLVSLIIWLWVDRLQSGIIGSGVPFLRSRTCGLIDENWKIMLLKAAAHRCDIMWLCRRNSSCQLMDCTVTTTNICKHRKTNPSIWSCPGLRDHSSGPSLQHMNCFDTYGFKHWDAEDSICTHSFLIHDPLSGEWNSTPYQSFLAPSAHEDQWKE